MTLQRNFLDPNSGLITDEKQFNLHRRCEVQHERAYNKAFSISCFSVPCASVSEMGSNRSAAQNEKHKYQIRRLQQREKIYWLAEKTAEARMTMAQAKLLVLPRPILAVEVDQTAA